MIGKYDRNLTKKKFHQKVVEFDQKINNFGKFFYLKNNGIDESMTLI